jgi:hypothetical protein
MKLRRSCELKRDTCLCVTCCHTLWNFSCSCSSGLVVVGVVSCTTCAAAACRTAAAATTSRRHVFAQHAGGAGTLLGSPVHQHIPATRLPAAEGVTKAMQAATLQLNPAFEGTQPAREGARLDCQLLHTGLLATWSELYKTRIHTRCISLRCNALR